MKFVFERKSSKSTISTVIVDESATSEEDVIRREALLGCMMILIVTVMQLTRISQCTLPRCGASYGKYFEIRHCFPFQYRKHMNAHRSRFMQLIPQMEKAVASLHQGTLPKALLCILVIPTLYSSWIQSRGIILYHLCRK